MRIATQSDNTRNLSDQGRGYWPHSQNCNWVVDVNVRHIGCFATESEAAEVAKRVHTGEEYFKSERTHYKWDII